MNYRNTRFWENFNIAQFETTGIYDIPSLKPYDYETTEFVGFNYAKSTKNKSNKSLHFFIDDYQFERLWREPEKYINLIGEFKSIMTPDFSLYTDFPKALQIYNHYRKMWCGAYWQALGFNVIPTVAWSDENSFEWCFDGMPTHSTVAISSVGTQANENSKELFLKGWNEAMKRLQPETVIFYGNIPKECTGNIIRVKSFQEKFREAKTDYGW
jgi:hypothetical protein